MYFYHMFAKDVLLGWFSLFITTSLGYEYETPSIHMLTLKSYSTIIGKKRVIIHNMLIFFFISYEYIRL